MSVTSPELARLDAPTLVEASAGTGKTHTITTYFVRGVLEQGLRPEQILVVTYTKAATAELRIRCRARILQALSSIDASSGQTDALGQIVAGAIERLGRSEVEERLRNALAEMDQNSILTIHGFCQRLLQDHPLLFGIDFDFEVAEDLSSMHADLAVDFWATDLYERPQWLLRALAERQVDVRYLAQLAQAATMPGVEILGPEPAGAVEPAVSQAEALHEDAAIAWTNGREEICDILLEDQRLNRTSYSRKRVEKWIPDLDALFEKRGIQILPDYFWKLAADRMRVKKGFDSPSHPFFDACARLQRAHEALAPLIEHEVCAFKKRFIEFVKRHDRRRREETAVLSFDDLLTAVHAPLSGSSKRDLACKPEAIARTISLAYPLALVDEFQDTDSLQYGIFKSIYGNGAVVYVGDPKQAIYAFRGADVFSYIGAAKDIGDREHTLRTNRRSDPDLVQAVNVLFSRPVRPFILDGIEFEEAIAHEPANRCNIAPALEVIFADKEHLEPRLEISVASIVSNEIAHLLGGDKFIEGRPLQPGDMAVLCRSNKQALAVTRALRAVGIPASLDGDSSVLDTEVALELRAVLEAALMPGDSSGVRRALLTSIIGVSPHDLAVMKDQDWSEWISKFRDWNATWHSHGVVRFMEDMLRDTKAEARLAATPAARRDLTDLVHIEELLMRGERERRRDPIALMQWLRRLDEGTPDGGAVLYEDLEQRPDAASGAVRVSTIHKSKGLEYGVVYCPFTWNDAGLFRFDKQAVKFHDERRNIKIDLGSSQRDAHLRQSEREARSEAIRLLYVAVTRARHHCVLFWGPAPKWKHSALAHLLHGADRLDMLDDDAMRADLAGLSEASGGTVGWRAPRHGPAPSTPSVEPRAELRARAAIRSFDQAARIASFTSLTGFDEKVPGLRSELAAGAEPPLFAELPGGTRTGLLLHAILQHADFADLKGAATTRVVADQLRSHGFDPALAEVVQRDLVLVAETPLTPEKGAPKLSELPGSVQLRELEFTLHADRPDLGGLAKILDEHGAPEAAPDYHRRLAEISTQAAQRFLRGFIDLFFEWQGRWYVADYKSNTLASYDTATITEAVQREHYLLQGQLYTAAAQRHLKQRLPGYDCARDWGGVLFLFLRGMRGPERPGGTFFDRQPAGLLDAVDRWLGGSDGSR
ncbi:MAG: hypothetical protein AMJ62_05425 [Myxococcales bacterium SG8_38]|nr:MAG: hypothetical protein AMJ62_05425 [Myxococcales bacterium SG8_38]